MDNQNYSNPTKQPILPNENTFNDYDRINDVLLCLKSLLSDYTTFIIECSHQQLVYSRQERKTLPHQEKLLVSKSNARF